MTKLQVNLWGPVCRMLLNLRAFKVPLPACNICRDLSVCCVEDRSHPFASHLATWACPLTRPCNPSPGMQPIPTFVNPSSTPSCIAFSFQVPCCSERRMQRMMVLTRLSALQVVMRDRCSICILTGGAQQPPDLPDGAYCLLEEWLLNAAEQYQLPASSEWLP